MYEGLASLLRMKGQGLTRDPISNMPKKYRMADLISDISQELFPQPPMMSPPSFVYMGGTVANADGGPMVDGDDYVVDAYTVAALGNGSSDAGAKVLDQMLPQASNTDGSYVGMVDSPTGDGMSDNVAFEVQNGGDITEARISPDEYIIDSNQVATIGGGDVEQGTQNLDKLREEIRQQTYGSKEQPKQISAAKTIRDLLNQVG